MNARTVLLLGILTALFSLSVAASAADTPAPSGSGSNLPAGAALPDNDAQSKARAALYSDEPKAKATPKAEPGTEAATSPGAKAAAIGAVSTQAGPQPDTEAQARARAALHADEPTPVMTWTTSMPETTSGISDALTQGMQAPALPTDASQQAQLDGILQQYRADVISAAEYHARRAEILAGK